MSKYWDPGVILPYQRVFNFINGPRSIGKTYSLLKWLVKQGMNKEKEFMYIVRTQDEKKSGVLQDALKKVCAHEYGEHEFAFDTSAMMCGSKVVGRCLALTEAIKVKKRSYPDVYYMVFDEYTIEQGTGRYLNGFQEPELFMNLYDTVDRRENRVQCFFLGNNTSYYNPYHLYPVFGLPREVDFVGPGEIWTNEVSLFQRAVPSEELAEDFRAIKWANAAGGTRYGEYALGGEYIDDRYQPIERLSAKAIYRATVHTSGGVFGFYTDPVAYKAIFSEKVNLQYPVKFSLTREGVLEGYPFITPNYAGYKRIMQQAAGDCSIVFDSMAVKSRVEMDLYKII